MRARFALALTAFGSLAGCGGQIPPAQNYAVITGRAFDAATNQPIPGVEVTVDTIDKATTANDGTYRIGNIPIGSCTIQVTIVPSGYAAPSLPDCGSVTAGQVVTIDIPLSKH